MTTALDTPLTTKQKASRLGNAAQDIARNWPPASDSVKVIPIPRIVAKRLGGFQVEKEWGSLTLKVVGKTTTKRSQFDSYQKATADELVSVFEDIMTGGEALHVASDETFLKAALAWCEAHPDIARDAQSLRHVNRSIGSLIAARAGGGFVDGLIIDGAGGGTVI